MFNFNYSQNSLTSASGILTRSYKKAATAMIKDDPKLLWSILQIPASNISTIFQKTRNLIIEQIPCLNSSQSVVSHETYFENNQGFKQAELLLQPIVAEKYSSPVSSFLDRNITTPQLQQYRGFKTIRSKPVQVPLGKAESTSTDDLIKNLVKSNSGVPKEEMEKISKLLKDTELNPEDKKKMGLSIYGYSLGYAAGQGKTDEKSTGKNFKQKLVEGTSRSLILIISLALVAAIFLGGKLPSIRFSGPQHEISPEDIDVCFDDVKGCDEAKQELQDIVEFLMNPDKFSALGGKLPKGVLLSGPPGTGKTLLARAVAGQAGVPYFHAAGSEFDEVLVGQGARRIRDLFNAAKAKAPCVVFIDEIDSVGSKRTSSSLHPYANQTINQLLSEMDGFRSNEGIIILGATNRPKDLDQALLRPGRFDTRVNVVSPDIKGRKEILELYFKKVKVSTTIDMDKIAKRTVGFSGADLQNLVNTAAVKAAQRGLECITMAEVEFAYDKQVMGTDLRSRVRDEEDIKITAYHEAGHTLVAYFTDEADPIHKVTIVAKGQSGGHTAFVKEKDSWHQKRTQLLAQMDTSMGGRIAEEILLGKSRVTGGASNDMFQATRIAEAMVQELGMSEKVGLRVFSAETLRENQVSDPTKALLDDEVNSLLNQSFKRASHILNTHRKELNALAEALITYETLDGDEVKTIIEGRPLFMKKKPVNGESITREEFTPNRTKKAKQILGEPILDLQK